MTKGSLPVLQFRCCHSPHLNCGHIAFDILVYLSIDTASPSLLGIIRRLVVGLLSACFTLRKLAHAINKEHFQQ